MMTLSNVFLSRVALLIFLAAVLSYLWWRLLPSWYSGRILSLEDSPGESVAIVFGARVYPNGRLSSMLRDRVETAVLLYERGDVQSIVMSGASQEGIVSEPDAMITYALSRGVPAEALQADYGGRRTYDTCYRAKHVFGLESAVLVTQAFHLPRALFTCEHLEIEVVGVEADLRQYGRRALGWSNMREIPATALALFDVILERPVRGTGRSFQLPD